MRLLSICALLLSVVGCTALQGKRPTVLAGSAMSMPYRFVFSKQLTQDQIEEVSTIVDKVFKEINHSVNQWNPSSEVSIFNRLSKGKAMLISSTFQKVLMVALKVKALSDNRFDVGIGAHTKKLKHSTLYMGNEAKKQFSTDGFFLTDAVLCKQQEPVELDFDAVSKGFALDVLKEQLHFAGFHHFLLEWAGEIVTSGLSPDSRAWIVGIPGPQKCQNSQLQAIELDNCAVATSSDMLQRWDTEKSEKQVSHYISTSLQRPIEKDKDRYTIITVKAKTCAFADALATTAMLFTSRKALDHWIKKVEAKRPDVTFFVRTLNKINNDP